MANQRISKSMKWVAPLLLWLGMASFVLIERHLIKDLFPVPQGDSLEVEGEQWRVEAEQNETEKWRLYDITFTNPAGQSVHHRYHVDIKRFNDGFVTLIEHNGKKRLLAWQGTGPNFLIAPDGDAINAVAFEPTGELKEQTERWIQARVQAPLLLWIVSALLVPYYLVVILIVLAKRVNWRRSS